MQQFGLKLLLRLSSWSFSQVLHCWRYSKTSSSREPLTTEHWPFLPFSFDTTTIRGDGFRNECEMSVMGQLSRKFRQPICQYANIDIGISAACQYANMPILGHVNITDWNHVCRYADMSTYQNANITVKLPRSHPTRSPTLPGATPCCPSMRGPPLVAHRYQGDPTQSANAGATRNGGRGWGGPPLAAHRYLVDPCDNVYVTTSRPPQTMRQDGALRFQYACTNRKVTGKTEQFADGARLSPWHITIACTLGSRRGHKAPAMA